MLTLLPMTDDSFSIYLKEAIPHYAHQKAIGEGLTLSLAQKLAHDTFMGLLSQGINTPSHYLYSITKDSTVIGSLWLGTKINDKHDLFIYDLILAPNYRSQGLGSKVMTLIENKALELGCKSIGLHVFNHNEIAISLYEKMGYHTTNRIMTKKI